jgi:hypothetical protein
MSKRVDISIDISEAVGHAGAQALEERGLAVMRTPAWPLSR